MDSDSPDGSVVACDYINTDVYCQSDPGSSSRSQDPERLLHTQKAPAIDVARSTLRHTRHGARREERTGDSASRHGNRDARFARTGSSVDCGGDHVVEFSWQVPTGAMVGKPTPRASFNQLAAPAG